MAERSDEDRPSPEALLEAATREGRGRLKIFLGAAPGVGKTYAMLRAAQLRKREGIDVVAGLVETHGRRETETLLLGLPTVPRADLEYRGLMLQEMDLEAILARRPQLALVDEMAHTNVLGSRHSKRYQDVADLIEAGIDVYSTVNVQHIESLNDVVARITGVRVRETVPDGMLQQADDIELIDLAPEELLQRLKEGKIYVPEQARRAIDHFFSPGTLTALRELALRHAAERIDEQMLTYMRAHAIPGPWPTRERIMVCVSSDPLAPRLIRTAKRAAERRNAPWLAVYIETHRHMTLSEDAKDCISAAMRLAEQLGAETMTIAGDDITHEIVTAARTRNVSVIVVGRSRQRRWLGVLARSLTDDLLTHTQTFDVLVVTSNDDERLQRSVRTVGKHEGHWWMPYALATAAVAIGTAVAAAVSLVLPLPNLSLVYLITVLVVAIRLGRWPSIYASVASFLVFDFVFLNPPTGIAAGDRRQLLTIVFFLIAAVLTSNLAARVQSQVEATKLSARRTGILYDFSRKIAAVGDLDGVLWAVVHHVAATIHGGALVLLPQSGRLEVVAGYPPEDRLDAAAAAAADWAWRHGKAAGRGSSTLPASPWLFLPLRTARGPIGVLGVQIEGRDRLLSPEQSRLLDALANQAAVAVERTTLVADIENARLLAEAERLRTGLLSSISHDLHAPLVSISGSAANLMSSSTAADEATRNDLLRTIHDEAERLDRFVQNLLDTARLGAGSLTLRREWVGIEAIIGSALERVRKPAAGRPIVLDIERGLPPLHLDAVLMEQVLVNVLDNACKHSPADGRMMIRARREPDGVGIAVLDEGPGIPEADRERVLDLLRGTIAADGPATGAGLGLAVCRGIVEAHGGTVRATEGEDGRGTCIALSLPVGEPPDAVAAEAPAALPAAFVREPASGHDVKRHGALALPFARLPLSRRHAPSWPRHRGRAKSPYNVRRADCRQDAMSVAGDRR